MGIKAERLIGLFTGIVFERWTGNEGYCMTYMYQLDAVGNRHPAGLVQSFIESVTNIRRC
jgi:hypothetical protein